VVGRGRRTRLKYSARHLKSLRWRRALRWVALVLVLAPAALPTRQAEAPALTGKWTQTDPPINLAHIEFGEINRDGEAVGFHHRPGGVDPAQARVLRIVQPADARGVYRARVALRDLTTDIWVDKTAASTFYPDAASVPDVIEAILAAFNDGHMRDDGRFIGASGRGYMIEGWYQNGRINAAYPLRGP
jgi:EndoU nuclease-like protein